MSHEKLAAAPPASNGAARAIRRKAVADEGFASQIRDGASDDDSLISAALRGQNAAFATIMSNNNRRLYRVAYAILRDDLEAQEAMQEAYLNAFKSLGGFNRRSRLSTWLTSIVVNECLGRLRHRRAARKFAQTAHVITDGNTTPDPERYVAQKEIRLILQMLVNQLPEPFQEVFTLRAFDHLSVEEVAVRLSIPRATVKTRYYRAKQHLAEALGPEFGTVFDDGFPFEGERCRRLTEQVLERMIGPIDQKV